MKLIIKRIIAISLGVICACIGLIAFADELADLEARPNSQKYVNEVSGLYQYGQFMSDEEAQACLNALEDTEIIEYIYEGMLRMEEEIYLDEFDEPMYPEQLETYFQAILNNYPDIYFVSMMYQYYIYDDGTLASLVPIYTMDEAEIAQTQALIDDEVAKACAVVKEGMSDFDKILAVHDYFADNYSYDYKNLRDDSYMRKHSMPAIFIDKTAVCQGYGLGFKYVLNKLGIECITVQSPAMAHLWNLVQLENGNWYHVDVTWDDPSQDWYDPNNTPTMTDEEYEFQMGDVREYFMLSDNKIKSKTSPHHSYTPDGMALDDEYGEEELFDTNKTIVWANGGWYYFDEECKLHKYNAADGSDEVVLEIADKWPYLSSFAYLYEYEGKLYYNTASKIMTYDPVTGTSAAAVENINGVGSGTAIYKLEMEDGKLICTISKDYTGQNGVEKTIGLGSINGSTTTPDPTPNVPTAISVTGATVENGATTVTLSGAASGVVCAIEYDGERLKTVKILNAAQTLTFEGIEADEIFVWESVKTMTPLCEKYTVE